MATVPTHEDLHLRAGGGAGMPGRALRWLRAAAAGAIGPTDTSAMRWDIAQRAITAAVIAAMLAIQQMRIPGWPAVLAACIAILLYSIPLAYLVFARERLFQARVLGLLLDTLVLMAASFVVLREMAVANFTSDIWLVFLVYIVSGVFKLTPVGSLFFTGLWIGWFALGTVLFFSAESQFYAQLPIRLVFFATIGLIALAIGQELEKRRARLEQQNRQTMEMLATLVEARDTDAGAHLHSIQHFCRALALRLGFSQRTAQKIAYASMMHDVGKANIPDAILKKPTSLSPEERRVMQEHAVWGEQLLAGNDDFELARQVARAHHEHWDGNGYPDGLAGEDIPLAARIVAVADVYDALITRRPYKEAWPPEEAVRELQRISGSHLEPRIVAAFVELWETGEIRRLTREPSDAATRDTGLTQRAA